MALSETQIDELDKLVHLAIQKIYMNDKYLIDVLIHERALVFRFGLYFSELLTTSNFKEYNIDFEYNKIKGKSNKTQIFKNGATPDIIVHKRGKMEGNILIMEFKSEWNKSDNEKSKDLRRLMKFTSQQGEYKFQLGIYCEFWSDEAESIYYVNGNRLNRMPPGIW